MVDVASSKDKLKKMTIFDNVAQLVSSDLARERQASVDAAAARIDAEHIAAFESKYVNIDTS